jgi:hypothetical protein
VFAKSILSVNYYSFLGKNSLDLIAYKFDGSNLNRQNALIVNALRFGDQPIGVAVTDASFFAADYNNLTARLWGCTDSANVSSCDISGFAVSPLSSIVSLSANLHDATKLYAGIFNGVIGVHSQSNLSGANIYQTATNDPNLGQLATMLAVGELNGDANPDLVVWYPNGSLSVYTGSPGPGLQFSPIYSTKLQATQSGMGVRPVAAAVGDIDGDGLDDIVVAGGLLISVLTNQGDSTFKVAQTITTSSAVTALAIGDVSPIGQGVSDLVIGSQSANTITVLENLAKY